MKIAINSEWGATTFDKIARVQWRLVTFLLGGASAQRMGVAQIFL